MDPRGDGGGVGHDGTDAGHPAGLCSGGSQGISVGDRVDRGRDGWEIKGTVCQKMIRKYVIKGCE